MNRFDPVHRRALISVQTDYQQYMALLRLAQEQENKVWVMRYRESALNLRRQAQLGAWILTGQWPQRTARAA